MFKIVLIVLSVVGHPVAAVRSAHTYSTPMACEGEKVMAEMIAQREMPGMTYQAHCLPADVADALWESLDKPGSGT